MTNPTAYGLGVLIGLITALVLGANTLAAIIEHLNH